jgi:hypothetical protein
MARDAHEDESGRQMLDLGEMISRCARPGCQHPYATDQYPYCSVECAELHDTQLALVHGEWPTW